MYKNAIIRKTNRIRAISLYCYLTGCYEKYIAATKLKAVGKGDDFHGEYENRQEAEEFLSYITPAVERFCDNAFINIITWKRGNAYKMGCSPDNFPHPIAVAMCIHHKRDGVKKAFEGLKMPEEYRQPELVRVYSLIKEHGMIQEAK